MFRLVLVAIFLFTASLFSVPAQAQFGNFNPGDAIKKAQGQLNKILHPNTNAPGNIVASADAPPNDSFANRTQLVGADCRAAANNTHATADASDPTVWPGSQTLQSVWWTWTAPATGKVSMDTLGGVSNTSATCLGVYVGDSPDTLIPVTRTKQNTDGFQLAFPVAAGQTYQIMSAALSGGPGYYTGQIGFNLHFAPTTLPAPVLGRDNFADRPMLHGAVAQGIADNMQATVEEGEPAHTAGMDNKQTVWWSWTAPATGKVMLDTVGIGGDSTEANWTIYTGNSLDALTPMIRSRGIREGDALKFQVAAGQAYQIVSNGANGEIGFNLHFTKNLLPAPVVGQDNFADRAVIKGRAALAIANNELATIESGEPVHTDNQRDAHTVWWTWTAPVTGTVAIDTINAGSNIQVTALAVYAGDTLDDLKPVAAKAASTDGYGLAFPVTAGTAYQIAANGYDGSCTGQVAFNFRFHPRVPAPAQVTGHD